MAALATRKRLDQAEDCALYMAKRPARSDGAFGEIAVKTILLIIGLLLIASGGLWFLQGLGIVTWPQESFMIAQTQWAWYGGATAAVGLALIVWLRR